MLPTNKEKSAIEPTFFMRYNLREDQDWKDMCWDFILLLNIM
jgi:hypothetical protein